MRTIFFILLLFMGWKGAFAQRQLAGQKGIEIVAGIMPGYNSIRDSYYSRIGITSNRKKGNYYFFVAEYRNKAHHFEDIKIPVETYSGEVGYSNYLLGDWRRTICLNLGLSAVAGYEILNEGEKQLGNGAILLGDDRFVYGGSLALSLETYLVDRLVILLQGHTKYLLGSSAEQLRAGLGLGLRYMF